ncbi:MAG: ABC transporter substrate-binding protein [Anaerolineae bacterium]|nr:ABC transporter substrate-binding protein [Anaerolineae bacterium]
MNHKLARGFAFAFLSIALAVMLIACAAPAAQPTIAPPTSASAAPTQPPAQPTIAPPPTTVAPPTQAPPAAAQELIVGAAQDQYRLEGDRANLGVYPFNTNITEPLVKLTPEYQVIPWLAESWEYKGDNTWEFKLREGVMFHNGDEFDAEAAKWSLDKQTRFQPLIPTQPEDITVLDKYTIQIKTSAPFGRVIESLAHPSYAMYSPKGDPGKTPIGTGPFKLTDYKQNESLTVEQFAEYWGEKSKVGKITFKFIPDNSTRVLALQSGDVDLIAVVPRDQATEVAALPDVTLSQSAPTAYYALYFATKEQEPPFDTLTDANLRKAINYAIDRETIATQVYGGYALPAKSMTMPVVLAAVDEGIQGFTYDPQKAEELLDAAGWTKNAQGIREKNGTALQLTLVSGFPPANLIKPLPEVIKAQLEKVGIGVELVEFNDIGAYYDFIDPGKLHMVIESGTYNISDPSFLAYALFCGCNTEGEAVLYKRFWIGPEYEEQVQAMLTEVDAQKVTDAAVAASKIWIDDFTAVAPIAYLPNLMAAKNYVQGLTVHPSVINQDWTTITVEK